MYVGIDLGGTNIKGGLIDDEGRIVYNIMFPTESNLGWERVLENIKKVIYQFVEQDNIRAIGIGVPGPVDFKRGVVRSMPAIPGAKDVNIVNELMKEFDKPVFVDNDANNFVIGELVFGVAKGKSNIVGITLGTGIGGGIVINGELYRGMSNYAGEVGHMVIVPDGIQCNCGKFGCWEAYGSATAIIKKALSYKSRKVLTKLSEYPDDAVDAKLVIDLAKGGDEFCLNVVNDTFRYIGLGIASLVNILNPEVVVIGGGVSLAGDFLLSKVRNYAMENIMPPLREGLEIVLAKSGNNAGILGAAALAKVEMSKKH
jgi:glucokinase